MKIKKALPFFIIGMILIIVGCCISAIPGKNSGGFLGSLVNLFTTGSTSSDDWDWGSSSNSGNNDSWDWGSGSNSNSWGSGSNSGGWNSGGSNSGGWNSGGSNSGSW